MQVFFYDQSFEGLLCALFDAYHQKRFPDLLLGLDCVAPLLTSYSTTIQTDNKNAQRVWRAIRHKISSKFARDIGYAWLSEQEDSDLLVFNVLKKVLDHKHNIETMYADAEILALSQLVKKVQRERHHIMQFVRFQKTSGDIYFAQIEPACNVLPVTLTYFEDRFADQKWIIYDTARHFGFFYDLKTTREITLDMQTHFSQNQLKPQALTDEERLVQQMWKSYFQAISIKERENPKLQRQFMPKRFWHYLPEMRF